VPALPVLAYEYSAPELSLFTRAALHLESTCMSRFGYKFATDIPPSTAPADPMDRRYGVMTLTAAKKYGYHLSADDGWGDNSVNGDTDEQDLTPAARAVLHGADQSNNTNVPVGGCQGEAQRKLGATEAGRDQDGVDLRIANEINGESYVRSLTERSVVAAFKAWSQCMKGKGYSFATPRDAVPASYSPGPKPSTAEIRVAVADMTCKTETNLMKIWYDAELRIQKAGIQKHFQVLTEAKRRHDARVKKAADAIGIPPP
jgi:hypothetical protein